MLHRTALSIAAAFAIAPVWTLISPSRTLAQTSDPQAITDLPENTAAVITINTSGSAWSELNRFQLFSEVRSIIETFFSLAAGESTSLPEEFEVLKEIPDWLGEGKAVVALLPTGGAKDVTLESNFILLVPVKDFQKFDSFLKTAQKDVPNPIERRYKGILLQEWKPEEPPEEPTPPNQTETRRPLLPQLLAVPRFLWQPASSRALLAFQSGVRRDEVKPLPSRSLPSSPNPSLAPSPLPADPAQPPLLEKQPSSEPDEADPDKPPAEGELPEEGLVVARFPGYVVMTNIAAPIERFIDAQEQPSRLTANPLFQKTLNHSQFKPSLLSFYMNFPEVVQFSDFLPPENSADPEYTPIPLPSRDELEKQLQLLTDEYSTVEGFVWVLPQGIRTQSSIYFQKPQPDRASGLTSQQDQILTRIPAITYLTSTGYNLKRQWEKFVKQFEADPELKKSLGEFRKAARQNIGLDLDRDLFAWMDGDYALLLYPARKSVFNEFFPKLNLGTALILTTSQRSVAETTLKRLNEFVRVKSKGEIKTVARKLRGQTVISWDVKDDKKKSQSIFAYTWISQDTLIVALGTGSMADLVPKPLWNLTQDYTFKTATADFPSPNEGYFYINMGASLSWIYSLIPLGLFPGATEVRQVMGTIRSISGSSLTTAEKEQVDGLLVLAPVRPEPRDKPNQ
ncbi:DUF3352 domain-containing protein [Leptolyngbya sp. 'hensonii']|uniref:DUF3352 domain-containing protein n=1 Tax=Leptolyngbya sp. 'hensonii' TaxID=1922337 RepID=UPI00117D75E2|nr:DUF3352 domain-containing protein [Leptolyngbya sp. 'hensonii']